MPSIKTERAATGANEKKKSGRFLYKSSPSSLRPWDGTGEREEGAKAA
jgi:hypothetical protein